MFLAAALYTLYLTIFSLVGGSVVVFFANQVGETWPRFLAPFDPTIEIVLLASILVAVPLNLIMREASQS